MTEGGWEYQGNPGGFQHKHIGAGRTDSTQEWGIAVLGVQCLDSSSGEEIQGVPFATGQSRSLEDQRNSLVQKQPAGSFRSEVGIGLSKVPGCLLRAIKNLRKKRSGGRGAPAPTPQKQQDVIPTSLVQLPSPPALDPDSSWGVQGCSWSPRHAQATGMSWSCCTDSIHGSVLTPRDQTLLQHLAWPPGKREKPR